MNKKENQNIIKEKPTSKQDPQFQQKQKQQK